MIHKIINKLMKDIKIPGFHKKPKKESVLRDLLDNPDQFVLTAMVDNGEININIKKREA